MSGSWPAQTRSSVVRWEGEVRVLLIILASFRKSVVMFGEKGGVLRIRPMKLE
jgi:hypothetical protein